MLDRQEHQFPLDGLRSAAKYHRGVCGEDLKSTTEEVDGRKDDDDASKTIS
jgi:hypothetical protein